MTSVFGLLTVATVVGTVIANKFEPAVNAFLNIETNEAATGGVDYFEKDYASPAEQVAASRAIVEEVEAEGVVLLKNNGALPLARGNKVTMLGKTSQDVITSGAGSSNMTVTDAPTYTGALGACGIEVNPTMTSFYESGAGSSYSRKIQDGSLNRVIKDNGTAYINEVPMSAYSENEWNSINTYGDAAIVVFGRIGGEGGDIPFFGAGDGTGNQLELTSEETALLDKVKALKDAGTVRKVIVLLNTANPMELDFLEPSICGKDYGIDAAMWIGEPGCCGLNSVGKILAGEINPSGKLPDTWCYDNLTSPAIQNSYVTEYLNADAQGLEFNKLFTKYYVAYQEGIYVGYKYYETRYEDYVLNNANVGSYDYASTVAYSFGYGKSYSEYTYSDFKLVEETATDFVFSVDVSNSGMAGKNTVAIYLQTPYTDYDRDNGVEKSAIQLAGYTKVALDANGNANDVQITVSKDTLKAYDANLAKTYVVDAGNYYFTVGNGSHEALNNILTYKSETSDTTNGTVDVDRMVGSGNSALVYKHAVAELDSTTFATSANGTAVTNHFDHADLNKFDDDTSNDITYVSRKAWASTMPLASFTASTYEAAFKLSANEKIASSLKAGYTPDTSKTWSMPTLGKDNGLKLIQFRGVEKDEKITMNGKEYGWDDLLDQLKYPEMAKVVAQAFHNTALMKSVEKPATHDENGAQGFTAQLTGGKSATSYPSEDVRAATFNVELLARVGKGMGNDALFSKTKYSGLYGPNANIHRTPYGGRNFEYYSEDAFLSGRSLASEVSGLQSKGVYAYTKHFALNDQETGRDGISVWANEQSIREIYLKPFQMSIEEADAHCVMTSFNRIGTRWAGADRDLLREVLKGEFGMDGMAITDFSGNNEFMDVLMGLQNGSDIWDSSSDLWLNKLNEHRNDPEIVSYLREASFRVLFTVVNSNAMNGYTVDSVVVEILPWWKPTLIAIDVVFGLLTAASAAMIVLSFIDKKKAA